MAKKVLVLHSGGLDSTVCVALAIAENHQVISLGIDYGQRHLVELHYAQAQCAKFGVERKLLRIGWDKPVRPLPTGRGVDEIKDGVSPAFLPGRNGVFLMLAAAEAAGIGATEVWTGINSVDFSGYPDCRPEFVAAFSAMLDLAIPDGPKIVAPLQQMTKPEIAKRARDLQIGEHDTWSCYRPKIRQSGVAPCMECDACVLHSHAWAEV